LLYLNYSKMPFGSSIFGTGNEEFKETDRITHVVRKEKFILDRRYEPTRKLGRGAYGMVVQAKDTKTDTKVAIKKNKDVFYNTTNAKRILREIKLLNHLSHPNIVKMTDMVEPQTPEEFNDVYLVLEYMQSDLHRVIYSENELSEDHVCFVIYQTLCALKYMHSANVFHRDLKPGNILINADCKVKICDFGLARGVSEQDDLLTEYVVTRWYRAPEVVLNAQQYDRSIDVWSVGCIMAEMFNRKPLFRGEDYSDQIRAIFKVLGTPSNEDVKSCVTDPDALRFIQKFGIRESMNWEEIIPKASAQVRELIKGLLEFNPSKRLTVEQALRHPCFAKFYDEDFVNRVSLCPSSFDCDYERVTKSKSDLELAMIEEMKKFRPSAKLPVIEKEREQQEKPNSGKFTSIFSRHRRSSTTDQN